MAQEQKVSTGGVDPEYVLQGHGAPMPIGEKSGQHLAYWVLSDEERAKGFIRPVRECYVHSKCGTETRMGLSIAESYARNPRFYGSTFCVHCKDHFPVGPEGEFVWSNTTEKVGS